LVLVRIGQVAHLTKITAMTIGSKEKINTNVYTKLYTARVAQQ